MMSYKQFVKIMENPKPKTEWRPLIKRGLFRFIIVLATYSLGAATACLFFSGCGRTIKTTGKAALAVTQAVTLDMGEALYRTGQQMGQTDLKASFGGTLPPDNSGSMASDHAPNGDQAVTWSDVERIRKDMGL